MLQLLDELVAPTRVGRHWVFASGKCLPVVAGSSDAGGGGGDGGGGSGGDGGGGDGGAGAGEGGGGEGGQGGGGDGGGQGGADLPAALRSAPPEIQAAYRESVAEANRQAAKYRSELRSTTRERDQLKGKVTEFEDLGRTEKERLERQASEAQARSTELEAQVQELTLGQFARDIAGRLNFHDPGVAASLIDRRAIQFDEETGAPTNLEELIEQLAKSRPFLVRSAGNAGGGEGGQGDTPQDWNSQLRANLRAAKGL